MDSTIHGVGRPGERSRILQSERNSEVPAGSPIPEGWEERQEWVQGTLLSISHNLFEVPILNFLRKLLT